MTLREDREAAVPASRGSDGVDPQELLLVLRSDEDVGDSRLVSREEDEEDGVPIHREDEAFNILHLLAGNITLLIVYHGKLADELHQLLWWLFGEDRRGRRHQDERRQDETELLHTVSPCTGGFASN